MKPKYTIVIFGPETDYVMALYLDGKLIKYGDCYHDQIDSYIRGYINGIQSVQSINVKRLEIPVDKCDDIVEMGDPVPAIWPDGIYSKLIKIK